MMAVYVDRAGNVTAKYPDGEDAALPSGTHGDRMMEQGSLGAARVRESFNPSKDSMVDKIKRYTADLIDLCEELKPLDPRLAALAQTAYEEAAMWAVKAATAEKKP
jgi:hypothetical protein